jgi:tetratricopeptide (TPR) repeat protein
MERAEACFTRAVELDGTFADAHFNVAMTLFRLGHYERARHHLQHYLSIEPTGPWADIARRRLNDMS